MIAAVSQANSNEADAVFVGRRGLYAIVDGDALAGRDALAFARDVLDAGDLFALQLRAKRWPASRMLEVAGALAEMCRAAHVPFVVNDRPDVAVLVRAHATHVGQDDLPIAAVRRVARGLAVGCSTHDERQVMRALEDGPDYVAFGPVFATASKVNPDAVVGLERLAKTVRAAAPRPVVAIGGITLERALLVRESGAAAGAVIAVLANAPEREVALRARALHRALGGA
jgi:thiamine-phosphate pyrophosphorylase